jgi:EAL domain-containing protein (putative c-di-GMP-specific phosphodiesterase class I)
MNYEHIGKLFNSYQLNEKDKENIAAAWEHIRGHVTEFSDELHSHVMNFEHARAFLKNDAELAYHKQKIEYWLVQLFSRAYTSEYYDYLDHINKLHKRIGLPPNYINSTFTFIRRFIRNKINRAGESVLIDSVEKLIDINLELLSTHYAGEDFEAMLSDIRLFRESLDKGYVVPFAQPIFDAQTLEIAGYECLCRIDHPRKGIIPPFRFLEIARQIDMYSDITRIMFEKSFAFFCETGKTFSLNVAFSDIRDAETSAFIFTIIEKYMPQQRLIIEIVETEELEVNEIIYDFCKKLRGCGVLIAIDDFGSGFSNFNNISKISPDFIKIDGSLIKDIETNFINRAAVEGIVATAAKLNIRTVAEYVHSDSVMKICRDIGIDKLQGFHLGSPIRLTDI